MTHRVQLLFMTLFIKKHSYILSRAEEPAVSTCDHDRRALQQLALNMNVKHLDLDLINIGMDFTQEH